jgi:hypothetical protein
MKSRRERPTTGAGEAAGLNTPELPTGKAFVLQLSRDTGPRLRPFAGRVEHLASGRRARFASFEDFRAAVVRLLGEANQR